MKHLNPSNRPAFSWWGMQSGALALLTSVALVALTALIGSQPGQAQQGNGISRLQKLTGAWNVQVELELFQVTFPALITFMSDGTMLTDEPPSPFETSGHGNWIATGPREAAFTFRALVGGGPDGQLSESYRIVGKLQYDAGADNWSGPFKIQGFDPDGNETFAYPGTFTGTRIAVETLD
jgi:hypothetical protein